MILYSKIVLINSIANRCEANFLLPKRLSNILKKKQHIKINYILYSFYFQTIIPEVIKQNQAEYCISRFQKCNLWCQHTPIFTFLNWICKYKNYSDINFFFSGYFLLNNILPGSLQIKYFGRWENMAKFKPTWQVASVPRITLLIEAWSVFQKKNEMF